MFGSAGSIAAIAVTLGWATLIGAADPFEEFDEVQETPQPAAAEPRRVRSRRIDTDFFEHWVFGSETAEPQVRQRLDTMLELHLDWVDRVCKLTEPQRKKIRLAARADVRTFFDNVDKIRALYIETVRNRRSLFHEVHPHVAPLNTQLKSRFFGADSLVHKATLSVLTPTQRKEYERALAERRTSQYAVRVRWVIAYLDSGLPLLEHQRQQLERVLLEETEPPTAFGQYDYLIVMYQASRLPQQRLRPIFDEAQWNVFRNHMEKARSLETLLKQNKLLDEWWSD